jgi:hypothetical protein
VAKGRWKTWGKYRENLGKTWGKPGENIGKTWGNPGKLVFDMILTIGK